MTDRLDGASIPPVFLDPVDVEILGVFRRRGPTYHINVSKVLERDIQYVSRRCKALAGHGLLERRDRTYYALTERGEGLLEGAGGSSPTADGAASGGS